MRKSSGEPGLLVIVALAIVLTGCAYRAEVRLQKNVGSADAIQLITWDTQNSLKSTNIPINQEMDQDGIYSIINKAGIYRFSQSISVKSSGGFYVWREPSYVIILWKNDKIFQTIYLKEGAGEDYINIEGEKSLLTDILTYVIEKNLSAQIKALLAKK